MSAFLIFHFVQSLEVFFLSNLSSYIVGLHLFYRLFYPNVIIIVNIAIHRYSWMMLRTHKNKIKKSCLVLSKNSPKNTLGHQITLLTFISLCTCTLEKKITLEGIVAIEITKLTNNLMRKVLCTQCYMISDSFNFEGPRERMS